MTDKNKGKSKGLENLVMWPPGQSGNPAGRPKGAKHGLRARLTQALNKQVTPDILAALKAEGISLDDRENAEALAAVLIKQALDGDIQSAKLIADQTESPMPKSVNLDATLKVERIERIVISPANKDRRGA